MNINMDIINCANLTGHLPSTVFEDQSRVTKTVVHKGRHGINTYEIDRKLRPGSQVCQSANAFKF